MYLLEGLQAKKLNMLSMTAMENQAKNPDIKLKSAFSFHSFGFQYFKSNLRVL